MKRLWLLVILPAILFSNVALCAQTSSPIVVLQEPNFPTVDSTAIPIALLHTALPAADFSRAGDLQQELAKQSSKLLILPYGSAFPEQQWPAIYGFLLRGGNLLTLGGRPFTRPVRLEKEQWQLLPETYTYARQLLISDYQETPGSSTASPLANQDVLIDGIDKLSWRRGFSMVTRLSQEETSNRVGASGTFDAEVTTLLWGVSNAVRMAAPIVEIDHFQNHYSGGRWIMVNCELESASLKTLGLALADLARRANEGAQLLRVTPTYPLYLPQEPWQFELEWRRFQQPPTPATALITVERDDRQELAQNVDLPAVPIDQIITLPSDGQPGFHTVVVRLRCGDSPCGIYRTGFWIRDKAYLDSGPKISVDHNYFRVDGKRIEVIGTTYMASDAQRLYFRYPNPYVWDQDMKQIAAAGVNMLRTGLWTDWNQITGNTDIANEHSLRTLEAYLMTARRYGLPVQFTLFAFMPEVFGGENPYLAPEALDREREFVTSLTSRFADVPFLMWDLINEPSFDNPKRFFGTHANNDPVEAADWNQWLLERYGSRDAIAEAWHMGLPDGPFPVPGDADMTAQSANDGDHPLSVYDFNLFAQLSFAKWAQGMRAAIRKSGSQQLITVGQDEGGALTSPSPSFFAPSVDFTTMHSWWFYDDLLWDSLSAQQKGLPMLVQETGVMTDTDADGRPRRDPEQDAALLERKLGIAVDTGAGAIEWLWNINALMRSQQEVTIGAVRPDGTETPQAEVLKAYATFAKKIAGHLDDPEPEPVAILTSQAEQFSVLGPMATEAQHRSVRALNYQCRIAGRMVSENHVEDIAGSKLTILPSAQMLKDSTWQYLIDYVRKGGNLLITGPIERDEDWRERDRLHQIGIDATASSLIYRSTPIRMGAENVQATFSIAAQRTLETLHLSDGKSFAEVKVGKGRVFVVVAPVELAESPDVAAAVYNHVLTQLGITPAFSAPGLPDSVLVRPRVFHQTVLYLVSSESSLDQDIDIADGFSGGHIKLHLPALRTAMVLINRESGQIVAAYIPPPF